MNAQFEEEPPKQDYDEETLYKKTKDLVDRKWAEIEIFITQEPQKYAGSKVKMRTLEEFYVECMADSGTRQLISDFSYNSATESYK